MLERYSIKCSEGLWHNNLLRNDIKRKAYKWNRQLEGDTGVHSPFGQWIDSSNWIISFLIIKTIFIVIVRSVSLPVLSLLTEWKLIGVWTARGDKKAIQTSCLNHTLVRDTAWQKHMAWCSQNAGSLVYTITHEVQPYTALQGLPGEKWVK